MSIYFGIVVLGITIWIPLLIWGLRSTIRVTDAKYKKIYDKIPRSTLVTLTASERKFYRLGGVAILALWFLGMGVFLSMRGIALYPFYANDTKEIPVTIVSEQDVRLTKKGLSYYKFLLSANIDGVTVEDIWVVAPSWFTVQKNTVVDGVYYMNGDHVELGILSAISPVFHWQQITGMIGVTVLAWFFAISQFRLAQTVQTRFEKLSLGDKQVRYQKALKK